MCHYFAISTDGLKVLFLLLVVNNSRRWDGEEECSRRDIHGGRGQSRGDAWRGLGLRVVLFLFGVVVLSVHVIIHA